MKYLKVKYHEIWPTLKGMVLSLVHLKIGEGYTTLHFKPATEKHILTYQDELKLQNDLYQLFRRV